jgi:hypothetical protein
MSYLSSTCRRGTKPFFQNVIDAYRETEAPAVDCHRQGDSLIVQRCPFCGLSHTHGSPDGEAGHRVAHCCDPMSISRDSTMLAEFRRIVSRGYELRIAEKQHPA